MSFESLAPDNHVPLNNRVEIFVFVKNGTGAGLVKETTYEFSKVDITWGEVYNTGDPIFICHEPNYDQGGCIRGETHQPSEVFKVEESKGVVKSITGIFGPAFSSTGTYYHKSGEKFLHKSNLVSIASKIYFGGDLSQMGAAEMTVKVYVDKVNVLTEVASGPSAVIEVSYP